MTVAVLINVTVFNPRNKHKVPPKVALAPSEDTVTVSPVHVHDDISITQVDPPPPVNFSISHPLVEGRGYEIH